MRQFIESSEGMIPEGELCARNVHAAGEHRLCLSSQRLYNSKNTNTTVVFAHLPRTLESILFVLFFGPEAQDMDAFFPGITLQADFENFVTVGNISDFSTKLKNFRSF